MLAPLLARGRAARVALPGGDIIGVRAVDFHLDALSKMGADINVQHGVVYATAPYGLKPAEITFPSPSVGATHQILMAAALTPGKTILHNPAREPEVVQVAEFLNMLGAEIIGAGEETIEINGVEELGAGSINLIGDRIESATYLLAAVMTKGDVTVKGVNPDHLGEFIILIQEMGANCETGSDFIRVYTDQRLKPLNVETAPFPGFATDMQPQLMSALSVSEGISTIVEQVYEGRLGHAAELSRMGANITVKDRTATIVGVESLSGAPVDALDIRAGAAMVLAALAADGKSYIYELEHLRRGYDSLEEKFNSLGACITQHFSNTEDYLFTGC